MLHAENDTGKGKIHIAFPEPTVVCTEGWMLFEENELQMCE